MFEPFVWMFKTEGFEKHFLYLFFMYIKFFVPAIICLVIGLVSMHNPIFMASFFGLSILLFIAPLLCIQGYFWELTQNIISRAWDISAANVYNGKIKEIYRVELPEIKTTRFIWRGIASGVATVMMLLPFALLVTSGTFLAAFSSLPITTALLLYVFLCAFIPALLWNYAVRDSVFAVWNIRKAIYIMGNYTGKYIWNTLLFIIFYLVDYALIAAIAFILGLNNIEPGFWSGIRLLIFYIFSYIQYLYCIYVYAYLLGTIAPPHEG